MILSTWELSKCEGLIVFSFPYYEIDPLKYSEFLSKYWEFSLSKSDGPCGYIPSFVIETMPWDQSWHLDRKNNRVFIITSYQESIMRDTLERAREKKTFKVLSGWRNELYPIYGYHDTPERVVSVERAGTALFGVNTYGVHMTVYVNAPEGMMIWVPRRAKSKQTYGGMLDNTVAGGLSTGETPLNCIAREAAEEASFSEEFVRSNAIPCGTVSYVHIRDSRAGGETGLIQPECQYIYDLEVDADVRPKPGDNEVEDFRLWSVEEAKEALAEGHFKPNCAVVLLDFFIRRGILTPENEPNYIEIVSRIHRRLPFPTSQRYSEK